MPTQFLPLVSLVTPVFNQASFVEETIQSVLAQDYPNLECIVIDDGSTDDTNKVIARYGGRVKVITQSNRGQAATLNRGWSVAAGELVGYLSADDRLHPGAISSLVRALADNPTVLVAYCDFDLIDSHGRFIKTVKSEDYSASRLQTDLVCQPGPGALFRKSLLDVVGGWNEGLKQVPDFEFWLRLSRLGPFLRVPRALAEYRLHDDSASFRPVSHDRSQEIVAVTEAFWQGQCSANAKRAQSKALLIACKSHAQSGRLSYAFLSFARASVVSPKCLLGLYSWRLLVTGLFRRAYYSCRAAVSMLCLWFLFK